MRKYWRAEGPADYLVQAKRSELASEVLAWVSRNREKLYGERLPHGVIDMEAGDHRPPAH